MQRLTITIDDDLLAELDDFVAQRGYANRLEAFRDHLRAASKAQAPELPGTATASRRSVTSMIMPRVNCRSD